MQTDTQTTVLLCLMSLVLIAAVLLFLTANRVGRIEKQRDAEKKCPYCAELIKKDATICRFCGRDLPVPSLPQQPTIVQKAEIKPPLNQPIPIPIPEPAAERPDIPEQTIQESTIQEPVIQHPSNPQSPKQTKTMNRSRKGLMVIAVIFVLCIGFVVLGASLLALKTQPFLSDEDKLSTFAAQLEAANTANPDGHLHEIMQEQGATLTAKEVQYDMANNLDKKFGLSGNAEMCDYYNWGYDDSIKDKFFCVEVTPSGGYLERWYIYFSRTYASELYQDLLKGNVQIFLIAEVQSNLYDENQENMATGYYAEWIK